MRRGYTMVEVLVAGAILITGLVPIMSLLTTSSQQVVKARDRTTANGLAGSVAEEMRMRRPADRVNLPATPAGQIPHLQAIIDAHKAAHPEVAVALDAALANFVCSATLTGPTPQAPLAVEVTWSEAGDVKKYVLEGTLGGP